MSEIASRNFFPSVWRRRYGSGGENRLRGSAARIVHSRWREPGDPQRSEAADMPSNECLITPIMRH